MTVFCRTGSLLPCILTHGILNALNAFGAPPTPEKEIAVSVLLTLAALGYAPSCVNPSRPAKRNKAKARHGASSSAGLFFKTAVFIGKSNRTKRKIEKNDFKKKMAYAMLKTARASAVFCICTF